VQKNLPADLPGDLLFCLNKEIVKLAVENVEQLVNGLKVDAGCVMRDHVVDHGIVAVELFHQPVFAFLILFQELFDI
jgi:hypothetical protein